VIRTTPILAALVLFLTVVSMAAPIPDAQAGPLVVKAYLQPLPWRRDGSLPRVFDWRAYVSLTNSGATFLQIDSIEGEFYNPNGDLIHKDSLPAVTLAAGEAKDAYLVYTNVIYPLTIQLRCIILYCADGKRYRQTFQLTPQDPSYPKGFVPGHCPCH